MTALLPMWQDDFPRRGTGFYNAPLYRQNSHHISGLLWGEYLKEIEKNLGFAYERFGHALKIHDEWEKEILSAQWILNP